MNKARKWFLLGFILCVAAMGIALYFELAMHLNPCALCIFERVVVICSGLVFLVALLHNPKSWGVRVYAILEILILAVGILLTGRQVWLQSLPPDKVPACGPGLNYLIQTFPIQKVIAVVFQGTGDCADKAWILWGVSLAGWTGIFFMVLFLMSAWLLIRRSKKS